MVAGAWVGLGPACADDVAEVVRVEGPPDGGALELIGVSGRRLHDGEVYRVPLDYEGVAVAPGGVRREAFVVRNTTSRPVTVLALEVRGRPDEWRVLAPIRAREVPLEVGGVRLPPGVRLDFDLVFAPRVEGERVATLDLVVSTDERTDVRAIEVRGTCARAPP